MKRDELIQILERLGYIGRLIKTLEGDVVTSISFSPDGGYLASSGSLDKTIKLLLC